MKIKFLPLVAFLALAVLFSCEKSPSKEAQKIADKETKMAEQEEAKSEQNLSKGVDHAEKAVEHRTKAQLMEAMAAVPEPTFENNTASEMAKKVGNDAREFVNSENYQEGGKYADKINEDINEILKKVEKGSISEDEASQIETYARDLAKAVGLTLE